MSASAREGLAALALALAGAACTDPCVALAQEYCGCLPNRLERDACLRQAQSSQPELTGDEEDVCSSLLDTCTCEAVERGDLAACGLAKAP